MSALRVIRRKKQDQENFDEIKIERKQNVLSMGDEIAENKFAYINFTVIPLKKIFGEKKELIHVDKFYPYAKGGPLYVDYPIHPADIDLCEIKKQAMKELGFRYIAINQQMRLQDALIELERK